MGWGIDHTEVTEVTEGLAATPHADTPFLIPNNVRLSGYLVTECHYARALRYRKWKINLPLYLNVARRGVHAFIKELPGVQTKDSHKGQTRSPRFLKILRNGMDLEIDRSGQL